ISVSASFAPAPEQVVHYHGFVSGEEKKRLFLTNDCFCLPTYYPAESFGLVLVEAMAYGMIIIATNWRTIPELLPRNHPGTVEPRAPKKISAAMESCLRTYRGKTLRQRFEDEYTDVKCVAR